MRLYWNLTIVFIVAIAIILNVLNFATMMNFQHWNMIDSIKIENLKTIYIVNNEIMTAYKSGEKFITEPELRLGGAYHIEIHFFDKMVVYRKQGDRLSLKKYIGDQIVFSEAVKLKPSVEDQLGKNLSYLWNNKRWSKRITY